MIECEFCGKAFYCQSSVINNGKHHFCCFDHANKWRGRNKTTHICIICGKSFQWSPSRSKSNNIKYCSLACRDADPERAILLRHMNVKQLSMRPNNLEQAAYTILDEFDVTYEKQYLIGDKFCVDAFVPSCNLVIQFDGDYWHGNPSRFSVLSERQFDALC
jgi:hypothetical protein